MATKAYYPINEIGAGKVGFSKTRSIIEAAFYGNNVVKVNTLKEAYELAKNSPGTVVTDMKIKDGETLVIGGMIQENEQKTVHKIPFLGDLPLIGTIFRSSSSVKSKSELVIMLTPRIINDGEYTYTDNV